MDDESTPTRGDGDRNDDDDDRDQANLRGL